MDEFSKREATAPLVESEPWRLDHKIPLVLLAGLVVQTLYFTIWLRDLSNEVKTGNHRLQEIWADRYTKSDAQKEAEISKLRDENLRLQAEGIDRRLTRHEQVHR
jgi:hypothetical protein